MKCFIIFLVIMNCLAFSSSTPLCRSLQALSANVVAQTYVNECIKAKQCISMDSWGRDIAEYVETSVRILYGWHRMFPQNPDIQYDKQMTRGYVERLKQQKDKIFQEFSSSNFYEECLAGKVPCVVSWDKQYLMFVDNDMEQLCFLKSLSALNQSYCWDHRANIIGGSFSFDNRLCVFVDTKSRIHIYDVASAIEQRVFQIDHACDALFSESGLFMAVLRQHDEPIIFQVADFDRLMANLIGT